MQLRIPLAPVAFPFLCIAHIIGFALGAVVSLSLIGVAIAGTTNGFGWQREVVSSRKVGSTLIRIKVRRSARWYTRLLGGGTSEREYFRTGNYATDLTTANGHAVESKSLVRQIHLYNMEHGV